MDVFVKWSEANWSKPQEEKSAILDEEVERFSKWLGKLPDTRASGALSKPERALIKTYLVQKLNGTLDEVL